MAPNSPKPFNGWTLFFWIIGCATVTGFIASALPAVLGNPSLTKTLGLAGVLVGAIVGFVKGLNQRQV